MSLLNIEFMMCVDLDIWWIHIYLSTADEETVDVTGTGYLYIYIYILIPTTISDLFCSSYIPTCLCCRQRAQPDPL